jgi:hypothetical protein
VERLLKSDRAFTLAASVAHEFNNDLTIILSGVAGSLAAMEPGHPARPALAASRAAAERCAARCRDLLQLAEAHHVRPLRLPIASLMTLMQPQYPSSSHSPALL